MSCHGKQTLISGNVVPPGDTQACTARPRLLGEVRDRLRLQHQRLRTEQAVFTGFAGLFTPMFAGVRANLTGCR